MGKKNFNMDDDFFPMDDDFDFGMDQKPPKGIKAVFKGLKNVGKWYIGGTINDFFPSTKELVDFPIKIGDEITGKIRDLNDQYGFKNMFRSKVSEIKNTVKKESADLKESLKGGRFFTESAEDKMMAELTSTDDFWADSPSSSAAEKSSDDKADDRSKRAIKANIKSTAAVMGAIHESAAKQQQSALNRFAVKAKMDASMHSENMGMLANISQNVVKLVQQQSVLIKATMEYSAKSLKMQTAIAKLVQDVRGAQWKMMGAKKHFDVTSKKKIKATDIFGTDGSEFDQYNYIAYMGQQIQEAIASSNALSMLSSMGSLKDSVGMMGGYTGLAKSLVGDAMRKYINNSIFSEQTRGMFKRLDRASKNFLPSLNQKFKNINERGFKIPNKITGNEKIDKVLKTLLDKAKDPIERLAGFLVVKESEYSPVTRKTWKPDEVHAFDNKAHKALTEVIPALLSKIYSSTSGSDEIMFDYTRNGFYKASSMYRANKREEQDFIREGGRSEGAKKIIEMAKSDIEHDNRGIDVKTQRERAIAQATVNFQWYGMVFDDRFQEDINSDIKSIQSGKGYSTYTFEKLTKDIPEEYKLDAAKMFMRQAGRMNRYKPIEFNEFVNSGTTIKSRKKEMLRDQEKVWEDETSAGWMFAASHDMSEQRKEIVKKIEKKQTEFDELTRNIKNANNGAAKALTPALKQKHDKLKEEIDSLRQQYLSMSDEGRVGVRGFEVSGPTDRRSFIERRMDDFDSTNSLVKSIHDMILDGITVYSMDIDKMPKTVKDNYTARRKAFDKFIDKAIEEERLRKEEEDNDARYRMSNNMKFDDLYKKNEYYVDKLTWLGEKIRGKSKFVDGAMDKAGNFINNTGNWMIDKLLKIQGYNENDIYYKEMTDKDNYKVKEGGKTLNQRVEDIKQVAKDLGVSDEFIGKFENKFNEVKSKSGSVASDFSKTVKESMDSSGLTDAIKKAGKTSKDVADKIVNKAKEAKDKVAQKITGEAQKNGLDPNSKEVQDQIKAEQRKIDEIAASTAEEAGGQSASTIVRNELRKEQLFRERWHIITGALGYGIQGYTFLAGGAAKLFGGALGLGGAGLRKAGKAIRSKSKNFGLLGRAAGLLVGGGLGLAGLGMQGAGLMYKGGGSLVQGIGAAVGKTIRGVGKAWGYTKDLITFPYRIVKDAIKRKRAGKATPQDEKILETAKQEGNESVKQEIDKAQAEGAKVEEKQQASEAKAEERAETKKKGLLSKFRAHHDEEQKKRNAQSQAKKVERKKIYSSIKDTAKGVMTSLFNTTSPEEAAAKAEATKEAREQQTADSIKKMADQMADEKNGINVKFSKEGTDQQEELSEKNREETEKMQEKQKSLLDVVLGKFDEFTNTIKKKKDKSKKKSLWSRIKDKWSAWRQKRKEGSAEDQKKDALEAESDDREESDKQGPTDFKIKMGSGISSLLRRFGGKEDQTGEKKGGWLGSFLKKQREEVAPSVMKAHREGSAEDQKKDALEAEKLEREKETAEGISEMVKHMTNKKFGGIYVRFSKEGLRDYDEMQEENMANAPGAGAGGGVGGLVAGLAGTKLVKGVKSGFRKIFRRGAKEGVEQAAGQAAKASAGGKGSLLKRIFGRSAKEGVEQAAKAGASTAAKNTAKPGLLKRFLDFIGKIIKRLGSKLGKFASKLLNFFKNTIGKLASKAAPALNGVLARFAAKLGISATGVGAIAVIAMEVASIAYGFTKGMTRARSLFGLGAGATVPMGMRFAAGCAEAFDQGLLGVPGIIQSVVFGGKYSSVAEMFFYEVFGDAATKEGISSYKSYNTRRAKIYGISNADNLSKWENGGNLLANAGSKIFDALTLGMANTDNYRQAKILGFESTRVFEEWNNRKYKPLEEIRKKTASEFGDIKKLDSISPEDPEKQKEYREAFLKRAEEFVKSRDLAWLTDKTTEDEVKKKLGDKSRFARWASRTVLGRYIIDKAAKKEAAKFTEESKKPKTDTPAADQPKNLIGADGDIQVGSSVLEDEIAKAKEKAKEAGISEGNIDEAVNMIKSNSISDTGTIRRILDVAATTSDLSTMKSKIDEIIKNAKDGTLATEEAQVAKDIKDGLAPTIDTETEKKTETQDVPSTTATTHTSTTTTRAEMSSSPSTSATLKLSSEIAESFTYSKKQYDEVIRHNKVSEGMFAAMVAILQKIATNSGINVNSIMDELSKEISSGR